MNHKIDKNIPRPTNSWGYWLDLAREMKVGDSVLVNNLYQAHRLISALSQEHGHDVYKCCGASSPEGKFRRVWRTK